jgi:hypothetical protein
MSLPRATLLTFVLVSLGVTGCQAVQSQLGPKLQRHDAEPAVAADACRVGDPQDCTAKCHAGHARACNTLAMMYEFGLRTGADYATASAYYQTSCAADFPQGCTNLGWMYAVGRGVERDGTTATCSRGSWTLATITRSWRFFARLARSGTSLRVRPRIAGSP